jgi:sigma-E factor negative regulatory protein RseB
MFPRLSRLCLTILLSSSPVFAAESEVQAWLEKMATAIREESYEGTFTYMRGYEFDTFEVAHEFEDGREIERIRHLNGERREVFRDGDRLVCRHEKSGRSSMDHGVPPGPFTPKFNENLANYSSLYEFALRGWDRVAGRSTVMLEISPRNDDRYGYRLWLDEETGLLLQSHLVDRGHIREVFQFSRIDVGTPIDDAQFQTALADGVEHTLYPLEPDDMVNQGASPQVRVSWLPNGFRQVPSQDPSRVLYSDGIATVSIFVEATTSKNQLGEIVTHIGGTVVITRRSRDAAKQITVVGEIPVDTARRVADSIEPVIY